MIDIINRRDLELDPMTMELNLHIKISFIGQAV